MTLSFIVSDKLIKNSKRKSKTKSRKLNFKGKQFKINKMMITYPATLQKKEEMMSLSFSKQLLLRGISGSSNLVKTQTGGMESK
jgi:dolichyl-phosphate-mannose--protein O-mannosyl transferase